MKKRVLNLFLLLPFIILLVLGCKKKYTAAEVNQTIRGIIANEENCIKGCDAKLEEYNMTVDLCMLHYETTNPFLHRLESCNHDIKCEAEIIEQIRSRCEAENKSLKEAWEKCVKDCKDKFPLRLKEE